MFIFGKQPDYRNDFNGVNNRNKENNGSHATPTDIAVSTQTTRDTQWFDYHPNQPNPTLPNHPITHLRIGFPTMATRSSRATTTPAVLQTIPPGTFSGWQQLEVVKINLETIAAIEDGTFSFCPNLQRVEFVLKKKRRSKSKPTTETPQSQLTEIGANAFSDCIRLDTMIGLELAELEKIGTHAFRNCRNLPAAQGIGGPPLDSLEQGAFYQCDKIVTVDLSQATRLTWLPPKAFWGCASLVCIQLAPNLSHIGGFCFFRCISLDSISLPPKLFRLEESSFAWCTALVEVTIPSMLSQICMGSFQNCHLLSRVSFCSTQHLKRLVTSIHKDQFFNCTSLHALDFSEPVPRNLWPILLPQFFWSNGGWLTQAGIVGETARNSIVFDFLCRNMLHYFKEEDELLNEQRLEQEDPSFDVDSISLDITNDDLILEKDELSNSHSDSFDTTNEHNEQSLAEDKQLNFCLSSLEITNQGGNEPSLEEDKLSDVDSKSLDIMNQCHEQSVEDSQSLGKEQSLEEDQLLDFHSYFLDIMNQRNEQSFNAMVGEKSSQSIEENDT